MGSQISLSTPVLLLAHVEKIRRVKPFMWVGPLPRPLRSYYDLQNSFSNVGIFPHTAITLTNISHIEKIE